LFRAILPCLKTKYLSVQRSQSSSFKLLLKGCWLFAVKNILLPCPFARFLRNNPYIELLLFRAKIAAHKKSPAMGLFMSGGTTYAVTT